MKRLLFLLTAFFFLTGCRSLGSWFGSDPVPANNYSPEKALTIGYAAERLHYRSMTYDLIIVNPRIIEIKSAAAVDRTGIRFTGYGNILPVEEEKLLFAVNGGIFREDKTPLGYYAVDKREIHSLNRADGFGNFYLKPNGVFYIIDKIPFIAETEKFHQFLETDRIVPDLAIQSGPLLINNGEINSAFTDGSSNRYIRNAVGITGNGSEKLIVFAISDRPVSFFDFAVFFRDFLNCSQALYLDGHISAMYLPSLNRKQRGRSFSTILYALEP